MKKNMNKTTRSNFITYGIVIVLFAVVQILSSTGNLSRLLTGLLVPLCVYTIAAISLNLVVGFSGELSLGHAGFMCVGAYSSALFSHLAADAGSEIYSGDTDRRGSGRRVRYSDRYSGTETPRRLSCDCHPCFWRNYQESYQYSLCWRR